MLKLFFSTLLGLSLASSVAAHPGKQLHAHRTIRTTTTKTIRRTPVVIKTPVLECYDDTYLGVWSQCTKRQVQTSFFVFGSNGRRSSIFNQFNGSFQPFFRH